MESSLDKYLRVHTTLPSPALEWIQKQTHIRTNFPRMLSGPVQGELLKMLVSLIKQILFLTVKPIVMNVTLALSVKKLWQIALKCLKMVLGSNTSILRIHTTPS